MHLRQWTWLALFAILTLPSVTPRLGAQSSSSARPHHRSTDDPIDASMLDDAILKRRLEISEENIAEMRLFDALRASRLKEFDDQKMRKLLERFRLDDATQLKEFSRHLKGMKLPDATQKELIRKLKELEPKVASVPPKDSTPRDSKPNENPGSSNNPNNPSSSNGNKEGDPTDPSTPEKQEWTDKLLEELLGTVDEKDLLDIFKSLGLEGDADNLRDLLRSMTDGRGLPDAFDANGPLSRMLQSMPDLRELLPSNLPSLPELDLHGLSLPSMPSVSVPSVSGPSWSGGLSMGDGGGLHVLIWIVAVLVLGAVLWKVMHSPAASAERSQRWRLGPWPVAPSHVSTRGELIVAFEYLALKVLGLDARTRNHLDLAAELGGRPSADPIRQRAAARLARLYEHARYAPPDEALDQREMADARHDLCCLAGVAVA
jgi:hypothetical protein